MIEPDVLRQVTRLITADGKRNTPVDRLASMVEAVRQPSRPVMQDVLQAPRDPVRVALDGVSDNTLVHIMALMLYGHSDDSDRPMVNSFGDAQAAARQRFQVSGRARVVRYVQSRPLSRYLLAGIARMQRDFEARRGSGVHPTSAMVRGPIIRQAGNSQCDSAHSLKSALRLKTGGPQPEHPAADSEPGDRSRDQDG